MECSFTERSMVTWLSGLLRMGANNNMAEKAGFEPAVQDKLHTRFPSEHLKPLGHFSEFGVKLNT